MSNIAWRFSFRELRQYTRLKVAEGQVSALQYFETMAKLLSMAFGGKKKEATKIRSIDQLESALNKMKG